jgi:uncharacterized protein YukE
VTNALPLLTGIGLSALFILVWLGGILYVRRMRRAMQDGPAPSQRAALEQTGAQARSIEEWLARAQALPEGQQPGRAGARDQAKLEELARRHFPHLRVPHVHLRLIGLTGVEKRLLAWVSHHTGLPDPFDALDRLTGDPDALDRASRAWNAAHDELVATMDELCIATERLHGNWSGEVADRFFPLLADYLSELEALAADLRTTGETLHGLQAEATLAEGTIVGVINLLVGSLAGYLVEAVLTAGTLTPAVAAQAQVELTWVLKQVALALARLQSVYTNTRHVLASVSGFRGLAQMRARFQVGAAHALEASIDATR